MALPRPDRSSLTDEEIVRLVHNGETDAFAEFVRRTQRSAYRLARRITQTHDGADEALRESYGRAFAALDRLTPGRPFAPWFHTIVARTARSALLRERPRSAEASSDPGTGPAGPPGERPADPSWRPDVLEGSWEAERAYASLDEEHRVVLALRVEADLPYASIAEALEIPAASVASRLARAREALLEAMGEAPRGRRE